MTIHGVGYRRLEYQSTSRFGRIWPLAVQEFRKIFRKKAMALLYIASMGVPFVKLGILYMMLTTREMRMMLEESALRDHAFAMFVRVGEPQFYLQHATDFGFLPFLVLTSLVSARSIAEDRSTNALEILWTRGVSPWGYFLGRLIGTVLLLGSVFLGAPLVLWLIGLSIAPDGEYFRDTIAFMPQVLLALAMQVVLLSLLSVSFSAWARGPNRSTFLWLGMMLGTWALARVLNPLTRRGVGPDDTGVWDSLWPWGAVQRVVREVSDTTLRRDFDLQWALLAVGVLVVVTILLLLRRLRYQEAI